MLLYFGLHQTYTGLHRFKIMKLATPLRTFSFYRKFGIFHQIQYLWQVETIITTSITVQVAEECLPLHYSTNEKRNETTCSNKQSVRCFGIKCNWRLKFFKKFFTYQLRVFFRHFFFCCVNSVLISMYSWSIFLTQAGMNKVFYVDTSKVRHSLFLMLESFFLENVEYI